MYKSEIQEDLLLFFLFFLFCALATWHFPLRDKPKLVTGGFQTFVFAGYVAGAVSYSATRAKINWILRNQKYGLHASRAD